MNEGMNLTLERRRTGWDIVFGILSMIAGIIVLGHVVVASIVSVLFVGWMMIIGGAMLAIGGIFGWRNATNRWDIVTGTLLVLLGLGFVRHTGVSLAMLTLLAGSLLLAGGVLRAVAAFQPGAPRSLLLVSAAITLILGALILAQWPVSALWFLGTVLGVELVIDGVTSVTIGRFRITSGTTIPATERTHTRESADPGPVTLT